MREIFIAGFALYAAPPKMDLGSSLEQQQGFEPGSHSVKPTMQAEAHELPGLPDRKNKRNPLGAIVNLIFIIADFMVMVGGLCTLTVFVLTENSVKNGDSSRCILFASYDTRTTDSQPFQFGESGVCNFVIYSMVAVSIFAAVYLFGYCSRIACSLFLGLSTFNCLAFIDLIAYTFFTLISITIAVMIRLGHDETCNAVKNSYPESIGSSLTNCTGPSIINSKGEEVTFSDNLYVAEMMAWTLAIILLLISLAHLVLLAGFFWKCCRSKQRGVMYDDDEEPSPFQPPTRPVDDDEPLLDPSSDAWNSNVEDDHTSFPPYNLGTDQSNVTGTSYQPFSENNYFNNT